MGQGARGRPGSVSHTCWCRELGNVQGAWTNKWTPNTPKTQGLCTRMEKSDHRPAVWARLESGPQSGGNGNPFFQLQPLYESLPSPRSSLSSRSGITLLMKPRLLCSPGSFWFQEKMWFPHLSILEKSSALTKQPVVAVVTCVRTDQFLYQLTLRLWESVWPPYLECWLGEDKDLLTEAPCCEGLARDPWIQSTSCAFESLGRFLPFLKSSSVVWSSVWVSNYLYSELCTFSGRAGHFLSKFMSKHFCHVFSNFILIMSS